MNTIGQVRQSVTPIHAKSFPRHLALPDGEHVPGRRAAVPSVRAQCDALGTGKIRGFKEKLRLPDVA